MKWVENATQSPEYNRRCAGCKGVHGSEGAWINCLTARVHSLESLPQNREWLAWQRLKKEIREAPKSPWEKLIKGE